MVETRHDESYTRPLTHGDIVARYVISDASVETFDAAAVVAIIDRGPGENPAVKLSNGMLIPRWRPDGAQRMFFRFGESEPAWWPCLSTTPEPL